MARNKVKYLGLLWPKVLKLLIQDRVRHHRGGRTARELAEMLEADPITVYRTLHRLQDQGLIYHEPLSWHRVHWESSPQHSHQVWFLGEQ